MRTETNNVNSNNSFNTIQKYLQTLSLAPRQAFKNIQKIIKIHNDNKEQKLRKQLNFLFQKIFQYYYSSSSIKLSDVDLPEFMYDRERIDSAEKKAFNALLYRVADKKTVNKLYIKGIKQFNERR